MNTYIMRIICLMLLSFLISACANQNKPNDVVAVKAGDEYYQVDAAAARALEKESDERVMCTRRSVVGSNRKQKVCTTQSEIDKDRDDARNIMDKARNIKASKLAAERRGN